MKLTSILGHSSELLRIIRKSYQPSDLIASDFFRKKKYIGSSERRFISELVFSTLRGFRLFEYCMNNSVKNIRSILYSDNEFLILVTSLYIFEYYEKYHSIFHPSSLACKFYETDDTELFQNLKNAVIEKFEIDIKISEEFFKNVEIKFNELDSVARQLLHKNKPLVDNQIKILSLRYAMAEWIVENWLKNENFKMSINEVCELSESLLSPAPLTIRIKLSQISRNEVLLFLNRNNLDCKECSISPSGITLGKRTQLTTLDIFKKGLIEVQDEGSQLISYALAPERDDRILDACAGAGGKSLHIADLISNSGKITSNDIDFRKLNELSKRAKRSGFDSIKVENMSKIKRTSNQNKNELKYKLFDKVLVDVPCSGMGTVRRMPMQKWRLTPELLKKHSNRQLKILEEYSRFVCDGGVLVYSTCSLMAEENEEVINKFLSQNKDFQPYPLKPAFDKFDIKIDGLNVHDFTLRLMPHKHGCDGFFIAKFIREN